MKKIILLMGAPGSGKGTQANLIAQRLNLPHVSTGDIFRNMISLGDEKGGDEKTEILSNYLKEGKLVPGDLVNELVKNFLDLDVCKNGCILDGYPRSLKQADYFLKDLKDDLKILFFDIEDDLVIKRISGRFSCSNCKKLYNKFFMKPEKEGKCDDCGHEDFTFRADDDTNIVLKRLEEYRRETLPVIEFLSSRSDFYKINANNSSDKITKDIIDVIKMI